MMDDSDSMMECPYNKSHRVQKSRMQTHLFKCRKNTTMIEMKRCPFNANHDIEPAQFEKHLETCPDRGSVQNHLIQMAGERTPVIMPYVAPILPPDDEDWDCDAPVQTYDPTAKSLNIKVLRGIQGASKSERKHHRAQERLRFTAVAENGGCVGAVGGYTEVKVSASSRKEEPMKEKQAYDYKQPIRRPAQASKTFAIPEDIPKASTELPKAVLAEQFSQLNVWEKDEYQGLPLAKSAEKGQKSWGSASGGLQMSGPSMMANAQNQVPVQASGPPAWNKGPRKPRSAGTRNRAEANDDDNFVPGEIRSYRARVSVDTGEGIPVPNLERDFPALGRGRGTQQLKSET